MPAKPGGNVHLTIGETLRSSVGPERPVQLAHDPRCAQLGAAASDRGEDLVPVGVVHGPGERAPVVANRDAHAPLRDPEQKVHGAVERIHDPLQSAAARRVLALLLAHEAIVRASLGKQAANRAL